MLYGCSVFASDSRLALSRFSVWFRFSARPPRRLSGPRGGTHPDFGYQARPEEILGGAVVWSFRTKFRGRSYGDFLKNWGVCMEKYALKCYISAKTDKFSLKKGKMSRKKTNLKKC